jgi:hypothetical protein
MANGSNCDQNPNGFGSFGLSATNPIPVNGPIGEILYLSSLRLGGERILFHRLMSIDRVDAFECVGIDGHHWDVLYLDMYHPRKSRRAPEGYAIDESNVLLSGVSYEITDFPRSLYPGIVAYSETRFGMSIADPSVRILVEKTRFVRPSAHATALKDSLGWSEGATELDYLSQIANETIDAQKEIYGMLMKFNQWTVDGKTQLPLENFRHSEIVFFPLAVTLHSLFSWHDGDATTLADDLCENVLKVNVDEGMVDLTVAEAVQSFRDRFPSYQRLLPALSTDQVSFGLELSRILTGESSHVVGAALVSITVIILKVMKETISEHSALTR